VFYLDPARFEWSWGVSPAKKNSCLLCLHPLNISLSKSNDRLSIGLNNVHRRSASSPETQKRVARQVLSKDWCCEYNNSTTASPARAHIYRPNQQTGAWKQLYLVVTPSFYSASAARSLLRADQSFAQTWKALLVKWTDWSRDIKTTFEIIYEVLKTWHIQYIKKNWLSDRALSTMIQLTHKRTMRWFGWQLMKYETELNWWLPTLDGHAHMGWLGRMGFS
jgi:hypothetical protein